MTTSYAHVLDMCVELAGIDDLERFRSQSVYCMAQLLRAKFVALVGLNDTQESCVPLATWPPGRDLPEFDLMMSERTDHAIIWALRLPRLVQEDGTNETFVSPLKEFLNGTSKDVFIVVPARVSASSFADMVFLALVPLDKPFDLPSGLAEKLAYFCARKNRVLNRLHQSASNVDVLARSLHNAEKNRDHLLQMLPSVLSGRLVGRSTIMQELRAALPKLAAFSSPILIEGESGTGKELVGRELHRLSGRANGPFIKASTRELVATKECSPARTDDDVTTVWSGLAHLIEKADGGTLYLDEVSTLPIALQGRILRVQNERRFHSQDPSTGQSCNFQLIAATCGTVRQLIASQLLHSQFFDRVSTARIQLPALRERREDITELTETFLQNATLFKKEHLQMLSQPAIEALQNGDYPGNIRQLQSIISAAAELSGPTNVIEEAHVRRALDGNTLKSCNNQGLRKTCDDFERDLIQSSFISCNGDRLRTAKPCKSLKNACRQAQKVWPGETGK